MRTSLLLCGLFLALAGSSSLAEPAVLSLKDTNAVRKLYLTKCSKCHKLYEPGKYPDAQWQLWMGKMSKKAKLTSEQERMLRAYIDREFRSSASGRASP